MKDISIRITRKVTQEELDNILDAALNACSDWCDLLEVSKAPTKMGPYKTMSEMITRGGELTFHINYPFMEGGETKFVLTKAKFIKGLRQYGNNNAVPFNFDDYDGPEADAVLQIALFGEIVYG